MTDANPEQQAPDRRAADAPDEPEAEVVAAGGEPPPPDPVEETLLPAGLVEDAPEPADTAVGQAPPPTPPPPPPSEPGVQAVDPSAPPEAIEVEPAVPKLRPPHWRTLRVLSALTLVLALASSLFAFLALRGGPETQIEAVAKRAARNLVNFDYRTIDTDVRAIRADATGTFLEQFKQALDGSVKVFRDAIVDAEGRSTGTVDWVTVGRPEGDRATAVVQVTQTVTNKQTPEPVTEVRTMRLSMVRTSSGWKVDDVSLLGV